jgi:hypothetical protein
MPEVWRSHTFTFGKRNKSPFNIPFNETILFEDGVRQAIRYMELFGSHH